jgi:hypothetical protein
MRRSLRLQTPRSSAGHEQGDVLQELDAAGAHDDLFIGSTFAFSTSELPRSYI